MKLKLLMRQANVQTLGPNNRYVIWFYGCDKYCPGCIYHAKEPDSFESIEISELIDEICSYKNIEGITISGGEPFLQRKGLLELVKALSNKSFGIILYTGRSYSDLMTESISAQILQHVDLLIDGEYIQELDTGMGLVGSMNQKAIFLSNRYKVYEQMYSLKNRHRKSEIRFKKGEMYSLGIPTAEEQIIADILATGRHKNDR